MEEEEMEKKGNSNISSFVFIVLAFIVMAVLSFSLARDNHDKDVKINKLQLRLKQTENAEGFWANKAIDCEDLQKR